MSLLQARAQFLREFKNLNPDDSKVFLKAKQATHNAMGDPVGFVRCKNCRELVPKYKAHSGKCNYCRQQVTDLE